MSHPQPSASAIYTEQAWNYQTCMGFGARQVSAGVARSHGVTFRAGIPKLKRGGGPRAPASQPATPCHQGFAAAVQFLNCL